MVLIFLFHCYMTLTHYVVIPSLCVFSTPPTPTFYTSMPQAVLQGSTARTAPKSAAAKTAQTVTTSLASVLAEPASLGRAASRVEYGPGTF